MAEGTTYSGNMIVPEVFGDMAQADFEGKVKVAGSPAVKEDNTLEGQPGETIHFPKWGALGELDDLDEKTAIKPEQLTTKDSKATIKEAGKAVTITDRSRLVGMGDPEAEAQRQFGILAARKVDADLIKAAQDTKDGKPYEVSIGETPTFGWDAIVEAIDPFGDEWEPEDFAGIYINSAQRAEAFKDEQFINASKLGDTDTAVRRGQLGIIGGLPVFTTNRVDAGKFLIIKNEALGLLYKQRPNVETERHALARSTDVVTTLHYAVKRLTDKGVAVATLSGDSGGESGN